LTESPTPPAPTQTADRATTWPARLPEAPATNLPAVSPSVERYGATVDQGVDAGPLPSWASGFDPASKEDHRSQAHSYLAKEWSQSSADWLWNRWGGGVNYGKNLEFASRFMGKHPELDAIFADFGLNDHPALLAAAAILGRKYATKPGDPKSIQRGSMSDPQKRSYDDVIRSLRAEQRQYQAEGDMVRANQAYAKEQTLIAAADGNLPIVNGRRTS